MHAAATGWGTAVPQTILHNEVLARRLALPDDWIEQRTGIRRRHIAGIGESTASLAAHAATAALRDAGVDPSDVDLVIVATSTPDFVLPSSASFVQAAIGATRAGAFDVAAACSGFLYALAVASSFVEAGGAQTVVVIGADVLSRITDPRDAHTSVLFGDGAGAAVVQRTSGRSLGPFVLRADGTCGDLLCVPREQGVIHMQGREVYRSAIEGMVSAAREVLDLAGLRARDVELFVAHQANARILSAVAQRLGIPETKIATNIAEVGNTSAASIPLAVENARLSGIAAGAPVLITAFGAGFVWGAGLLLWHPAARAPASAVEEVPAHA